MLNTTINFGTAVTMKTINTQDRMYQKLVGAAGIIQSHEVPSYAILAKSSPNEVDIIMANGNEALAIRNIIA